MLSQSHSLSHTHRHTRPPPPPPHTHTLTYALSLSLTHTHTHARAHTHTDIHIHAHTHTYAHARTHSHIHVRARAHTRTLTHYIGMVFGQWLASEAAAGRHRVTQQTNALSLSVRRRSRAVHTAVGSCCRYATGGCPACRPRRRGSLFASRHGAAWYYVLFALVQSVTAVQGYSVRAKATTLMTGQWHFGQLYWLDSYNVNEFLQHILTIYICLWH